MFLLNDLKNGLCIPAINLQFVTCIVNSAVDPPTVCRRTSFDVLRQESCFVSGNTKFLLKNSKRNRPVRTIVRRKLKNVEERIIKLK